MRVGSRHVQSGLTYVWALGVVAVLGVGLAAIGDFGSADIRRTKEQELLRIGSIYAQAIQSYRRLAPSDDRYPATLEELVLDTRFADTRRHLRRLYPDPIAPHRPWGLVRGADGRIRGVFSTSSEAPLRNEPIFLGVVQLPAATRYLDWKFVPKVRP